MADTQLASNVEQKQEVISEKTTKGGNPPSGLQYEKTSDSDLHISRYGGWLESRFHFRFANWHPADPKWQGFGPLHVLNDDLVAPGHGFGMHPHANQEIFSYILRGQLTHKDSKGNRETLGRGSVQFMSAGTGVWHSEHNEDKSDTCRFLQVWIRPSRRGLPVQYGSHSPDPSLRHNRWLHLIGGTVPKTHKAAQQVEQTKQTEQTEQEAAPPVALQQDVNVLVAELDLDHTLSYRLRPGRQAYLVCPEGSALLNGEVHIERRAALRLFGDTQLVLKATGTDKAEPSAHFLLIEMPLDH